MRRNPSFFFLVGQEKDVSLSSLSLFLARYTSMASSTAISDSVLVFERGVLSILQGISILLGTRCHRGISIVARQVRPSAGIFTERWFLARISRSDRSVNLT